VVYAGAVTAVAMLKAMIAAMDFIVLLHFVGRG
jgi:hypothetical protein